MNFIISEISDELNDKKHLIIKNRRSKYKNEEEQSCFD